MALPGFGFVTVTAKFPAEAAVPLAVSCVEETNVVASAVPASCACAPETKPLPLSVIENAPVETEFGVMLFSTGIGFHRVTALPPEASESAALMALTVTMFGFGKLTGAVKTPADVIVPAAALPPVTPFTCQVTDEFDVPLTVAAKVCVAPARTVAGLGETETLMFVGDGVPGLPGLPLPPATPAQSA